MLALWSSEAFKLIGNTIGKFIQVDLKQMGGSDRRIGKIMVELDTFEGLPEEIEINWQVLKIHQRLDYVGVPFCCSWCKETGHLCHQCTTTTKLKFSLVDGLSGLKGIDNSARMNV
jgi:hypothetical protein